MKLTKDDIVRAVAEETGLTQADTNKVLKALFDPTDGLVALAIKKGNEVQFTGFGSFSAPERPAREGRNPHSGEAMTIAAGRQVKFKAGSPLKTFVK